MSEVIFKCNSKKKSIKMDVKIGQAVKCCFCDSSKRTYKVGNNYKLLIGEPPVVAKEHSLQLIAKQVKNTEEHDESVTGNG